MNDKLATITQLFDGKEIRSIWDAEKEDYYFSVVDVILVLTDSPNPRDYWYRLKTRMTEEEKSEVSTKCRQLKMKNHLDFQIIEKLLNVVGELLKEQKIFLKKKRVVK